MNKEDELIDALEHAFVMFLINGQYTTPYKKLIKKYRPDSQILKLNPNNMPAKQLLTALAIRMVDNE